MGDSLRAIKDRLRARYMGRCGIHGLGIREADDAITLHVTPGRDDDRADVLREIEATVAPHRLIVVEEGAAGLSPAGFRP